MKNISIKSLSENPVKLFDDDWSLITAGDENGYNTMTASWGGIGKLWGKDVCFIFIRPQRYTYEFIEKNDLFTVSFYGSEMKKALSFCGSKSGRDYDKAKETGLVPLFTDGTTTFEQAKITIVCKKIAYQDMKPEGFIDPSISANYAANDYHRVYVGEIVKCYVED
ncbi:MAG: flavin reductase [Faecalibacterium sp.]|nr:flavin reductase [Ruminococcus sp.]MCM1392437.1 flavin reductase [Ruminococcus sp.]MCM1486190.1 flavin reductase [Faecalibacterium sp.]